MKLFVGITDKDWYERLSQSQPDEVNFWKPGEKGSFAALQHGELFLFKLHAPHNFIVGGGYFVKFSRLPVSLAWLAFGEKNGVRSLEEFKARIGKYRAADPGPDPLIGNIILSQPFWLPRAEWISAPRDWPISTVQGKTYDALEGRGFELMDQLHHELEHSTIAAYVREETARYGESRVKVRLGQGGFRVVVTDAYSRRCAITGENTLPVLEAAHIKPYGHLGPHDVRNGLLLRSDMHILFDKGLITITPDLRLEVSSQIREQYSNGKLYYSYHGQDLRSLPPSLRDRPDREFLSWHNDHQFIP